MAHDEKDSKLVTLFHALRDYDERHAVPFDGLRPTGAAGDEKVPARSRWLILAAVGPTCLVVGFIIALIHHLHQRPLEDPTQWALLSEWQGSTDSLLHGMNMPWSEDTVITVTDSLLKTSSSFTDTTL